jgi:hypothetical protein
MKKFSNSVREYKREVSKRPRENGTETCGQSLE